jgi:hypothetical protein
MLKLALQLKRLLRADVVQYFQMLKDNGQTGALALSRKEFGITAEVMDFSFFFYTSHSKLSRVLVF